MGLNVLPMLPLLIAFVSCCCPYCHDVGNTKSACVENEACYLSSSEFLKNRGPYLVQGEKTREWGTVLMDHLSPVSHFLTNWENTDWQPWPENPHILSSSLSNLRWNGADMWWSVIYYSLKFICPPTLFQRNCLS